MQIWEQLSGRFRTQLGRHHAEYSDPEFCYVQKFPDCGHFNGLMKLEEPPNEYSCGVEMAMLALRIQGINITDRVLVSQVILTDERGTDPYNLDNGLKRLGVECIKFENATVSLLEARMSLVRAIYILCLQDPDVTYLEIVNADSGHYMAACAMDNKFVYFADPGYADGKKRITRRMMPYLWFDSLVDSGKIIYGFMIEVPVLV